MSNDIVAALKGLSLHGMASAWPEVLGTARIKTLDHETVLHQLLKAEAAQRGFHAGTAENSVTPNPAQPEARPGRSSCRRSGTCSARSAGCAARPPATSG